MFQLLGLKVYQPRFVMARDATLTWKVGDACVNDGKFAVIGVSKTSDVVASAQKNENRKLKGKFAEVSTVSLGRLRGAEHWCLHVMATGLMTAGLKGLCEWPPHDAYAHS